MSVRGREQVVRFFLLTATYFLAGRLGLAMAFRHGSVSPVWPPSGIALAVVLLYGYRSSWAVFFGAFLVNITTIAKITALDEISGAAILSSTGIALGNTLEAVLGVFLIRRYARGETFLERPGDIFRFVVFGAALAPMISASVGLTSLELGGYAAWSDWQGIWLTWWLGDASGILIVSPVIISFIRTKIIPWNRWQALEGIMLFCVLLFVSFACFGELMFPSNKRYPLEFLCIPIIVWAAVRFSHREVAIVTLSISSIAIIGTLNVMGPFSNVHPNESLLLLQSFVATLSVVGMVLAASIFQRRLAEEEQESTLRFLEADIIARKKAEEKLEIQSAELIRSNAALQQFAYAASHDLQEPLRMVTIYAELLHKKYHSELSSEAKEFLQQIVAGTKRMSKLLKDLLTYARAAADIENSSVVETTTALEEVMLNLQALIKENGAEIGFGALPAVRMHKAHLVQLLQNLLVNAIRYREAPPPRVQISAERKKGHWMFAIKDNGIGIHKEFQREIFSIFKRVDRQRQESTGIGLAICQRIVERYGGQIWVDSEPGKGSTFFFTLPREE